MRALLPPRLLLTVLAAVAAAAWARPAAPGEESLDELLSSLRRAATAEERLALIPRLAARREEAATNALAALARGARDARVRIAATAGLGRVPGDAATGHLVRIVREGGVLAVRRSAAEGLATREDADRLLLGVLDSRRTDTLEKGLVAAALGAFRDEGTRTRLLALAADGDPDLRGTALRALARRPDALDLLVARLGTILREGRDREALLQALDVLERIEATALLPAVERLRTALETDVQAAAEHVAAVLERLDEIRRVRQAVLDGYADPPATPPPPPPVRGRFDVVFVVDLTGSTVVVLEDLRKRIREEAATLARLGTSLRLGLVGYRSHRALSTGPPQLEVLPLTFDRRRFEEALQETRSRGADSEGASISAGLAAALDRMDWREDAQRLVRLVADSGCHDPDAARLVALLHRQADGTRTHVTYVLRTRTGVPDDLRDLARDGGTGAVEVVE